MEAARKLSLAFILAAVTNELLEADICIGVDIIMDISIKSEC